MDHHVAAKGAIATFIIDWPVLVLIGVIFGAFAPRAAWWRSRAFAFGLGSALLFTLVAMISYAVAPDWMWMYFLDPSTVVWATALMPLGYLFTFVLGFAAAVAIAELGASYLVAAGAAAVAAEVVVVAATWDRYRLVATADEWRRGAGHELVGYPTGPARLIALMGAGFVVVLVAAVALLWKERRASPADR